MKPGLYNAEPLTSVQETCSCAGPERHLPKLSQDRLRNSQDYGFRRIARLWRMYPRQVLTGSVLEAKTTVIENLVQGQKWGERSGKTMRLNLLLERR